MHVMTFIKLYMWNWMFGSSMINRGGKQRSDINATYMTEPSPHHVQLWLHVRASAAFFKGALRLTISDQEFETFWHLAKFYHNRYTLGLQIWYSCEYISHEHEYIFYFFIVQLWKLTEASWSSKVIVSGDWNGCHIEVTVNCQILILLTSAFGVHIRSAQNHACHAQQTKNQNSFNYKRNSSPFCSIFYIWSRVVY